MASIVLGDIIIKDFASRALTKVQKKALTAEGAVSKMMRNMKEGGKNSVPVIEALSYRLDQLREGRDRSFSRKSIQLFNQEIRKTERQLTKLRNLPPPSMMGRFRALRTSIASNILPLGGVAAAAVAVRSALRGALGTGMAFGKEMSHVQALSNASAGEFERLTASARGLGATTSYSATQAAQGMGYLAMAGFNTNQIIAATPATLSLAAAGAIQVGEAADIASNILSQFNLRAEETGRVADVMAKTTTTSNTNMREMGEAMKYLGPTAQALNVGLEESSAVVGLLANSGIKGSLASRALGTALTRLTKPTKQMQGAMSNLGVEFFNKDGEFVGLAGVVGQLETAFVGLNDKQKAAYLSTIFGAESFQEMSILMQNGSEKIRAYTDDLILSKGVADRIADIKLDNLAGDWTKLKSVVSDFAISSYNKMKPFLRTVTTGFTSFVRVLNRSGRFLKALGVSIAAYIVLTNLATIGTTALSVVKGGWAVVTSLLTIKQWALNTAMLANPILAIVAGVVGAITYFTVFADKTDRLTASQRALQNVQDGVAEATQNERVELAYLVTIMEDQNTTVEMRTTAYRKLKRLYPDILAEYKNEADALANLDTIQKKITDNIEARARQEVAAKLYKQTFEDEIKKNQEIAEEKAERGFWRINDMPRLNRELEAILKKREQYKSLFGSFPKIGLEESELSTNLEATHHDESVTQTTENIVTGGKRQTVLTINIDKVIENIEQQVHEGADAADEVVDKVLDGLTRRIHGTARGLIN